MTQLLSWRRIGRIHERYGKLKSFSPAGRRLAIRAEMVSLGLIEAAQASHFYGDLFTLNPTIFAFDGPPLRAPLAPELLGLLNRPNVSRGE